MPEIDEAMVLTAALAEATVRREKRAVGDGDVASAKGLAVALLAVLASAAAAVAATSSATVDSVRSRRVDACPLHQRLLGFQTDQNCYPYRGRPYLQPHSRMNSRRRSPPIAAAALAEHAPGVSAAPARVADRSHRS